MNEAPSGGAAGRLEIVLVDDGHAAAVAEFIRQVWNPAATAESVRSARAEAAAGNVAERGVAPPTWIALQDGRALGYVTTIPIRWWDGRQEWPAYWIKGLMVLPEFRNGPIGYAVMKAAVARLPRSAGLAAALPARRLFGALGYTDLGAIPNWIRPIALGRMLQRLDLDAVGTSKVPTWARPVLRAAQSVGLAGLVGGIGSVALRGMAAISRFASSALRAGPFAADAGADELDTLWQAVRADFPSGVVRNAPYLVSRYPSGATSPYLWVAIRDRAGLVGIAILRRPRDDGDPRLRGIRVAALVEVLHRHDRPSAAAAILGAVERTARELGADAILATGSAPALQRHLSQDWYLPIGGNVHFLFRDVSGEGAAWASDLSGWWLTRGDGHSDDVF